LQAGLVGGAFRLDGHHLDAFLLHQVELPGKNRGNRDVADVEAQVAP
jgi:hypothetical protein